MSTFTTTGSIESLLAEINSLDSIVIESEGDESTRKKLIVAAESLQQGRQERICIRMQLKSVFCGIGRDFEALTPTAAACT